MQKIMNIILTPETKVFCPNLRKRKQYKCLPERNQQSLSILITEHAINHLCITKQTAETAK